MKSSASEPGLTAVHIIYTWTNINTSQRFTSFITISQLLEFNVKIQCDRYKQITTTTESSVPWRDLNFPIRFAAKHCSIAQFLGCSYQVYAAICCKTDSKLCGGKLFNGKRKPHTMFEKRHKINKFANYQNIIVRNSPALDRHVFIPSQNRWSMIFDVMRMISTLVRWQDPCWLLCKFREHRLDFI